MINLSLVGAMTPGVIALIAVLGVIFVGTFTTSVVRYAKNKKARTEEASREVDDVNIKRGIRYTEDATIVDKHGDMNLSYVKGDLILKQNHTYYPKKSANLKPGKYTILSARDNEDSFNVRIGTYVKEYKHGEEVVLAEGEEITPVSPDIILR